MSQGRLRQLFGSHLREVTRGYFTIPYTSLRAASPAAPQRPIPNAARGQACIPRHCRYSKRRGPSQSAHAIPEVVANEPHARS